MAVTLGRQGEVLLDQFNLHQFAKTFLVEPSVDILDASVLGTTSRNKVPGLKHATASAQVFYDDTVTVGSYAVLQGKYGSATPGNISFAPAGFTLGNRILNLYAHEARFTVKPVVDDLVMMDFAAEASEDAVDFGVSLHAHAAETSFPVTGASVDNLAASSNGGVAVLHVTAIAGAAPSITYKIQMSTNDSTWVDLVSFTAVSAVGTQRVEVTAGTAVSRYLRTTATNGGTTSSITGVVGFARR